MNVILANEDVAPADEFQDGEEETDALGGGLARIGLLKGEFAVVDAPQLIEQVFLSTLAPSSKRLTVCVLMPAFRAKSLRLHPSKPRAVRPCAPVIGPSCRLNDSYVTLAS